MRTPGHIRPVKRGMLIAFEGIDGSGKSTQLARQAEQLNAAGHDVLTTREYTDGEIGQKIGAMARSGERVAPELELEWFMLDRREHVAKHYLYVSSNRHQAKGQIARRKAEHEAGAPERAERPGSAIVIEVLLEIIHGSKVEAEPSAVAARLAARGVAVSDAQVEALFEEYGLKKTAKSRSRRSRR